MGIKLTSPTSTGLTVILEHNQEAFDQTAGKRVVQEGKRIKFEKGMAEIPEDWMPVLEKHPAFTGSPTQGRSVYLLSEAVQLPAVGNDGPRVVAGAVGSPVKTAEPPHIDWDTMTPKSIADLVKGWPPDRLEAALSWELARRRRGEVYRVIGEAMLTKDGVEVEPDTIEGADGTKIATGHVATIPGPDPV